MMQFFSEMHRRMRYILITKTFTKLLIQFSQTVNDVALPELLKFLQSCDMIYSKNNLKYYVGCCTTTY